MHDRILQRIVLRRLSALLPAIAGLLPGACSAGSGDPSFRTDWSFGFSNDAAGWTPIFADYPADADTTADGMVLTVARCPLPDAVPEGHGLFLSGRNTSDDGTLWILVGTDSGFEGTTALYYDAIRGVLEPR